MLEEREDFQEKKISTADKQRRQMELTRQGQAIRDQAAYGIVGGEIVDIGGNARISNDGSITSNVLHLFSPSTSEDGVELPRKRRRNNRAKDAIEELLQGDRFEHRRLEFEMEKFDKEMELRRMEIEERKLQLERENTLRQRELDLQQLRAEREAQDRQAQLQLQIEEGKRASEDRQANIDLKLKEMNMMMQLKLKEIDCRFQKTNANAQCDD